MLVLDIEIVPARGRGRRLLDDEKRVVAMSAVKVAVVRSPDGRAAVAHGVGAPGARVRLVEAGAAARARVASLRRGPVRRVAARRALAALGVRLWRARTHHSESGWTLGAAQVHIQRTFAHNRTLEQTKSFSLDYILDIQMSSSID